jgi:hypothetical protein
MEINYTVHSYQEGQTVANVDIGGVPTQVMVNSGATIELTDELGSSHTFRFTDVMAARLLFGADGPDGAAGAAGTKILATLTRVGPTF